MRSSHTNGVPPHFTVIIPCKDRAEFLKYTLETCVAQNFERFQIIVSDDSSTDATKEMVLEAAKRDPRILYTAPVGTGGMRNNFEHALQCVKPGFVIALGGDDGLMPNSVSDMWTVLRETNMELLAWPAPVFTYAGVRGPHSNLTLFRDRGLRIINSNEFLVRQAKKLHYLSDLESPMFYVKGVASTNLIEKVRQRSPSHRFYSCATPDGYSGIVLAGETPRYAYSGKPYSIYGLSPASQGLAYLSNSATAKKESDKFFEDIVAKAMHAELAGQPYSPLITLMTVDYLLTARDLPGWPGRFPPIDYRQVLSNSVQELSHGLYGNERICRELGILNKIAEKHALGKFFHSLVTGSRRRKKREAFSGSGINARAFLFDGEQYNLANIGDAAIAASTIHQIYCDLRGPALLQIISRSLRYRFNALQQGDPFPPAAEWTAAKTA